MVVVQQAKELKADGVRVWAVDPGVRAMNLLVDAEAARRHGAPPAVGGAQVVVDVVRGKMDDCVGMHVSWEGGVRPW